MIEEFFANDLLEKLGAGVKWLYYELLTRTPKTYKQVLEGPKSFSKADLLIYRMLNQLLGLVTVIVLTLLWYLIYTKLKSALK